MSSPYDMFSTDVKAERDGISVNYGDFELILARAGGANKKYQKALTEKTKPMRRALATAQVDPKRVTGILMEVFAETVVLDWKNVTDREGNELPFSKEACLQMFKDLPDFFMDVQEAASNINMFRQQQIEDDQGN